ncbi:MAG: hypothetical protein M3290_07515 [Actinomycetota bacterium]|nr:hypothetical protein [Actinomycetota bacterium]
MVKELPDWEPLFIEEAIRTAEERLDAEKKRAARRAVQLAREQAYHRLAAAIDRPARAKAGTGQLSLFPTDPSLFD